MTTSLSPMHTGSPFTTLLVANRGEIARRIFRSARAMGLRCVAVYVDADADAPFVREADEAVRLATSYLDGEAVLAAAALSGSEAIHPGYGFLSENGAFAASVIAAGLRWVGPTPDVIEAMGDKLAAKRAAVEAGVPTLPSTDDPSNGDAIGYPLLVKAAAGGGGKGMRVVEHGGDLAEAVASAQREALNGFGDSRVFLERYVARSRHIEIQILGDEHGNLVHLGERECSIQRRHQKIIEESPSPIVDAAMRTAMGDAALRLGSALGYRSAGTFEFLVDDATREFFFLEVNTRLQVEHPVTEEVTGIDLVREQLRIAAGEPLGYEQSDITFNGSAIEARLYAEDPEGGFLPATGTLRAFAPAPEPRVRWDSGVEEGSVVSVNFDPMLAKVIAHGPTRADAAGRLARALERLHLGGVVTNRDFLAATLRSPAFLAGDTTTDFIDRIAPQRALSLDDRAMKRAAVAAALWAQAVNRESVAVLAGMPSGWRNSRMPYEHVSFGVGDRVVDVSYQMQRDCSFLITGSEPGTSHHGVVHSWDPESIDIAIDGRRWSARITRHDDVVYVQVPQGTVALTRHPRFKARGDGSGGGSGGIAAPMPGVVLDVRCAVGDVVSARQVLVVLEAMKMEHHVKASVEGVVAEVRVKPGDQVENGVLLLRIHTPGE